MNPPDPRRALQYSQQAYDLMQKAGVSDPVIMDTRGWVLCQAGKSRDGTLILQDAVQRKPFAEARYHLAVGYLADNLADAALRQLDEARTMIEGAGKAGRPVSADLIAKIDQAAAKAKTMLKQSASNSRNR
jgi:hypothetical protein